MEDNNKENCIKKSYIILLVITISFIVGLIVLVGTTDLRAYNNAKKLYAKREYVQARKEFERLEDYKNSEKWVRKSSYQIALQHKEEKKYTKAYKEFEKLAPYKKSKQEMKDCTYLNAKEELRNNPTSEVYFTLVDLGDYKNSKKLSEHAFNSCKDDIYDTAIRRYEDGRFEEALSLFEEFGEYKDTQQYIEYCNLMIRFQGAYKSTLSKNDSKVLNGWKLTTYDMDAWNASGVSKDEEYLTLTKDENQYYMYEKQYSSVTEAFSVYALIETDDKTSQGIDEIYTGKDLDVLYKKDSSINERTLEEGYDKEISRPDPQIGMTKEEVRESTWGEPKRIHKTSNTYGITEQWVYEYHKYIYFDDGIVTSIQE